MTTSHLLVLAVGVFLAQEVRYYLALRGVARERERWETERARLLWFIRYHADAPAEQARLTAEAEEKARATWEEQGRPAEAEEAHENRMRQIEDREEALRQARLAAVTRVAAPGMTRYLGEDDATTG